ncbi:probable ATP-dependent RNA helicase DDX52 [Neocloeon triangulifer]|uniref:probable ATP-dependent RNA helicase DDX52 n=1 Tax=Neocloeon triangulifer TaxID=2078957 RepID=UPI00286F46B7|nr:probable ATP-dependent RNA helicase DDX52 [Neocloeon triangulifer]XP_059487180.1 probable ATP-dependent RNA helicase DDX52 [Neocloeon triangulifer]XP_059487181.1 probable ATP-dependent RNA helicase DDX52 [Neocloeon triangulifer]
MDVSDIFRKLSSGAKFNTKRFNSHARKFQMTKKVFEPEPVVKNPQVKVEEDEDFDLSEAESDEEKTEEENEEPEKSDSEEELTLMGSIKAGKDGKPVKKIKKKKVPEKEKLKIQHQEEVNRKRNLLKMSVWTKEKEKAEGVPEPAETFEQLAERYHLAEDLLNNVLKAGYCVPTPVQMQAIPAMLEGRQVMACAPTGSGKTAAFLLPLVHHLKAPSGVGVRAIVVAPTRELAQQIHRECLKLADGRRLRIHLLSKVKELVKKSGPEGKVKADILISTPNRLIYLLEQEPPVLSMKSVEWLVVDESDKLFEEGKQGFREQLAKLYQACESSKVRRAMFSATHTNPVASWCRKNLEGLVCINVGVRNSAVDLVDQQLRFVGNEEGKLLAFRTMVQEGLSPPVLIFVQTKDRAQQLFQELIYDGINVDVIHAGRSQQQRDNTIRSFREGKIWVLICTELLARGVDFKGVNMVINYDFPPSAISYIHRIGRTGRAGRRGRAVTFFTSADSGHVRTIANLLINSGCEVPEYIMKLDRASKTERKERAMKAPKRKQISTEPSFEKEKRLKIRRIMKKAKNKGEKAPKKD